MRHKRGEGAFHVGGRGAFQMGGSSCRHKWGVLGALGIDGDNVGE